MRSHLFHILALIIILFGCKKDETELQLDRIRSIQGTYTGILTMESKSFGLYKEKQNTIEITAFSAEELSIKNLRTVASASIGYSDHYIYIPFYWIGTSDCMRSMSVVYQGTGEIRGDSLFENGTMIINGQHSGTWKTRSIKTSN